LNLQKPKEKGFARQFGFLPSRQVVYCRFLSENERMIHKVLPVGPLQCNCSIIGDETTHEAMIIDPGDDIEDILASVRENKLKVSRSSSPRPSTRRRSDEVARGDGRTHSAHQTTTHC